MEDVNVLDLALSQQLLHVREAERRTVSLETDLRANAAAHAAARKVLPRPLAETKQAGGAGVLCSDRTEQRSHIWGGTIAHSPIRSQRHGSVQRQH